MKRKYPCNETLKIKFLFRKCLPNASVNSNFKSISCSTVDCRLYFFCNKNGGFSSMDRCNFKDRYGRYEKVQLNYVKKRHICSPAQCRIVLVNRALINGESKSPLSTTARYKTDWIRRKNLPVVRWLFLHYFSGQWKTSIFDRLFPTTRAADNPRYSVQRNSSVGNAGAHKTQNIDPPHNFIV